MDDRVTICLIGPSSGGKSSILATLQDCITFRSDGFPTDYQFAFQEIDEAEFSTGQSGRPPSILRSLSGDYAKLRQSFGAVWEATDTAGTYSYFFRLEATRPRRVRNGGTAQVLLRVVDAGGEIAVPPDGGGPPSAEVFEKFSDQISTAEALVFAIPLVNLSHARWIGSLSEVITNLANQPGDKLKRVIVAFTQYERSFVQFGPSAFRYALDPKVALHNVLRCVDAAPWLQRLRALEMRKQPISVRFTVTSSFGFARKYDNPNIDPHQPGDVRFKIGATDGRQKALWRPFLTAEPFLWAALGEDSVFTFSFAQIYGDDGSYLPPEDPPPQQLPPPSPSWWQQWLASFKDTFDVNRP